MLDFLLNWFVVIFPFLITVGATVLALKPPAAKHYVKFVIGAVFIGLAFSALIYWQQLRAVKVAANDRESAIEETATKVSKKTTDSITENLATAQSRATSEGHRLTPDEMKAVAQRAAADVLANILPAKEQPKNVAVQQPAPSATPSCTNAAAREQLRTKISTFREQIKGKYLEFQSEQQHVDIPMHNAEMATPEQTKDYETERKQMQQRLDDEIATYNRTMNAEIASMTNTMANGLKVAPVLPIPVYDGWSFVDADAYLGKLISSLSGC